MMVAASIFLVVTGAVYALLKVGTSNRFTANQRVESIQNVRIALNQIGRECLDAGVEYPPSGAQLPDDTLQTIFGTATDGDSTPDFLVPIVPRDGVDTNSLSGLTTDRVTFVYGDDTFRFRFNGTDNQPNTADDILYSYIPVDQISSSTDFRITSPTGTTFTSGSCGVGSLYMLSESGAGTRQAIGVVTDLPNSSTIVFGTDTLTFNQPSTSSGVLKNFAVSSGSPGRLTPIVIVTYFVDANGTLYRRLFGNYSASGNTTAGTGVTVASNQWLDEPLAFGVEDFQLEYLLRDGTVTTNPTAAQRINVRQVEISITVRSPERDPQTGNPYRTTLTATFNARNLAYSGR
jgi:hypothetical protein